jgi:SM-20-related protein
VTTDGLIFKALPSGIDCEARLDRIAQALTQDGYVIIEDALPADLSQALLAHFMSLDESGFNRAGIGRENDFQLNAFIRTDEIHWLEDTHPVTKDYFARMESLRGALNRRLFLGLFDYECHYARYPEGAFYLTHVDTFRGTDTRVISTVLYLNPDWLPGDGGELVLYRPDQCVILETVEPRFGRMVLFLSAGIPHAVLPVKAARYSIAGWFRKNNRSVC